MNTEQLIEQLTESHQPMRVLPYARTVGEWLAVLGVSFVLVAASFGLRPDLATRLGEPIFVLELGINLMLVLAAGVMATSLAYPDRAHNKRLMALLTGLFISYSLLVLMSVLQPNSDAALMQPHEVECLLCLVAFAALPALWMLWRLRRLVSVKPMLTGLAALLMAAMTGALGVRLVEQEVVMTGFLLWHYVPLLVISASGYLLGKVFFRW